MANFRKLTRDSLVNLALADADTGFNAQLASMATSYGIIPFTLDFGAESANVVYGSIDDEGVRVSRIFEFPGAVIFTTEAVNERRVRGARFSGFVAAAIAVYLRMRSVEDPNLGANQPNLNGDWESLPDAVEDAMHEALHQGRGAMSAAGVNFSEYRSDRDLIVETGDGYVQKITFTLGFEVTVA